jgi:predicted ester cyclase
MKIYIMEQTQKNKEFIIKYFNALSNTEKTRELLSKFMTDEGLIEHILFFDSVFPNYAVIADEITAEANRVVVRCRMTGKHEGSLNGIPPTHKEVEFPFAIGYEIENNMIIHHWLIADQMMLMEQLGIVNAEATA